jgi:O-methyltransferase
MERPVDDQPYAIPRGGLQIGDCLFYHTMDIPGHAVVKGEWDLRGRLDSYLGGVNVAGKSVLEIGPASGFLTFEMEKRGATVTAIEVQDDPGWDFVPFPEAFLASQMESRRDVMRRLKNSWWFCHAAFRSKAKLVYASAYDLPEAIGRFDVALLAAVLLHTKAPLQIVEQCARRANTLIITDLYYAELEGRACSSLLPTAENRHVDTWWQFSTDFFTRFLGLMGFGCIVTTHSHAFKGNTVPFFTIVATRQP